MFNIQIIRKGRLPLPAASYSSLSTDASVSNGYATIPSISAYGTFNDFTLEFWVKRNGWASANGRFIDFFGYFNGWTTNRSGSTDKVSQGGVSSSVMVSLSDLADLTWTHIAFVRSGSTALTYFNGSLDNSGGVGGAAFSYTAAANIGVGANTTNDPGNDRLTFLMTDIRFWKEARSGTQIADNMNTHLTGSETNLVGNWQFENGSLTDSTSNGNSIVLQAAASISSDNPYS